MDNEKSPISIEYLIELISSIKSALSNIDNCNNQYSQVLSEISENITVLSELNKRQTQDQKMMMMKYDSMVKSLDNLASEIKLSNQQIIMSHEKLQSNLDLMVGLKKNDIEKIESAIEQLKLDTRYLRQKEEKISLVNKIENMKQEKDENKKNKTWLRIVDVIKNINSSIGMIYKIILVIFCAGLIILWIKGIISWNDIKNIIVNFKIF
jgi:chromosome segregation ATPase